MGYNTYTTSDLINDIQIIAHVPLGNNTFTAAKLLRLAQFELQTPIASQLLATRGGYYLTYQDYAIASDGLYSLPFSASTGALENVELVQPPTIIPVNQIEEPEQLSTISPTATSYGFFMKGNYVQILPIPNIGQARLWYSRRTSALVQTSACAQITAIGGGSTQFTVSSVPSTMAIGTLIDVLGDQPPFNIFSESNVITNVSGSVITLTTAVTTASIGDWIALADQTCIPQIPPEFRILLAQRVVCKIYEIQGYTEKLPDAKAALAAYEESTFKLITPRVKSQTKIINCVNGGFLSGNANRMTNFPAR